MKPPPPPPLPPPGFWPSFLIPRKLSTNNSHTRKFLFFVLVFSALVSDHKQLLRMTLAYIVVMLKNNLFYPQNPRHLSTLNSSSYSNVSSFSTSNSENIQNYATKYNTSSLSSSSLMNPNKNPSRFNSPSPSSFSICIPLLRCLSPHHP